MSDREDKAQRNRELMPNVAAIVDEWKQYFPGLTVTWAKDHVTGHEMGKKSEDGFVIPPRYFPTQPVDLKKGRKK